eukprot:1136537-Pelagomonas_calceolata.AAC.13
MEQNNMFHGAVLCYNQCPMFHHPGMDCVHSTTGHGAQHHVHGLMQKHDWCQLFHHPKGVLLAAESKRASPLCCAVGTTSLRYSSPGGISAGSTEWKSIEAGRNWARSAATQVSKSKAETLTCALNI